MEEEVDGYHYEDRDVERDKRRKFNGEPLMETTYRDTKAKITTEPEAALSGFAALVGTRPDNAELCFKALKRTVQIYCSQGEHEKMKEAYRVMLTYMSYYFCRSLEKIMDLVSRSFSQNLDLLEELYQTTVETLEENKSGSRVLFFKTNLKLCKILFYRSKYPQISKVLKELHKYCQKQDGTYDRDKGSELFEVYANEFQLYTETKDNKDLKMQQLYQKALAVDGFNACNPRVIGIFRECGGKMHMTERQWEEAAIDFRVAFINYGKAGNQRCIKCLKYGLLANMMGSNVNPFDRESAKPYENHPEILAMKALIEAYQKNDFAEFERKLNSNCMDDPYIKTYMEDQGMLKKVKTQVLLNLIKPYTKIGIRFVSTELGMSETEVLELLRSLILDSRIDWSIDGVNGYLLRGANVSKLHKAIDKWSSQLRSLFLTITNRI